MNNAQMTARIGLFFVVGVALIWIAFEALHSGGFHRRNGYTLTATFETLKELHVGDSVRMAGVQIGSVEQTGFSNHHAQAVLRISPEYKISNDAVASIASAGLLGTNYISFDLGKSDQFYQPGEMVRTKSSADINTVMNQLGDLSSKLEDTFGSISALTKGENGQPGLFQRLNQLVADNGAHVSATLSNLHQITDRINSGQGTIGRLINDPKLHDDALATIDEIKAGANQTKDFIANAKTIVDQVKSGEGPLGTLIYNQETADNLKRIAANFRQLSDKLNNGQGTLGKLISDDSVYNQFQGVMKKADQAFESAGDSSAISAVGVVANAIF